MQNPIQKCRQSSTDFEKPGVLFENLKTLTSSNYPHSSLFFVETSHTFCNYQCLQKSVWDFFLFCLDLELFAKIKKTCVLHTHFLYFY